MAMKLDMLTIEQFRDKVGDAFIVEDPDIARTELTLIDVAAIPNYANAARAPFSLLFTSPGRMVLPQRTYALRHPSLGLQSIFLVPIAGDAQKVTFQAIFN
jgi:hypothetical protein